MAVMRARCQPRGYVDGVYKLPRTALLRDSQTWIKLLTKVLPDAMGGFGFEGKILRPGAAFDPATLPVPALLLEEAGAVGPRNAAEHGRRPFLYLLWLWDAERAAWRELARAESIDGEWADALRPVALRVMQTPPRKPPQSAERAVASMITAIDRALAAATDERVMEAAYNHLAARRAREA